MKLFILLIYRLVPYSCTAFTTVFLLTSPTFFWLLCSDGPAEHAHRLGVAVGRQHQCQTCLLRRRLRGRLRGHCQEHPVQGADRPRPGSGAVHASLAGIAGRRAWRIGQHEGRWFRHGTHGYGLLRQQRAAFVLPHLCAQSRHVADGQGRLVLHQVHTVLCHAYGAQPGRGSQLPRR